MLAAKYNHLQWDARRICTDELVKFTQVSSADTRAWSHHDEHKDCHFNLPDCHFVTGREGGGARMALDKKVLFNNDDT